MQSNKKGQSIAWFSDMKLIIDMYSLLLHKC